MSLPSLRLKSNADRRIKAGHLWVFSNEVDTAHTPLTTLEPGQEVSVENASGKFLQLLLLHMQARLVGIGLDAVYRHLLQ